MPIQKRPLVTAARFPGIFQHGTNQGLAQGITSAFGNVSNAMIQNKIIEAQQTKTAAEAKARLFGFVRGIEDTDAQKSEIMRLARESEDPTEWLEALSIPNADQRNLYLSRKATEGGVKPAKPTVLSEGAIAIDEAGNEIASNPKSTQASTAIGKARQDLKNGLITKEDFDFISKSPDKYQSSVGKLIQDKQLAIKAYGADSEQVKMISEAIASEAAGEDVSLTDIAGLRKEFTKGSGDFIQMRDAFNKIQSASDTGAGDVSLIFSFMKIIDPGSTVREGEFATAEETAGIPTRVVNLYNKALEGDRLGDEQRNSFKSEAANLFNAQMQSQIQLEDSFKGLATRGKMNSDDVVVDYIGDLRGLKPTTVPDIKPTPKLKDLTPAELESMSLEELEALQ